MKQTAGKRLKAAEIAEITGLSEDRIHDIAHRHGNRIPSRKVGRIQVYDEKAADLFTKIAESERTGQGNPEVVHTQKTEQNRKHREKPVKSSRLGDISKTREEENKAKIQKSPTGAAGVPNHLINTVAMQGQQFSRFADRITTLEDRMNRESEAFGERIDRLERQMAALQKQMEIVDSWITHVDGQLDQNDRQITQLAEETYTWTEHVRDELAWLKLSWWKRRQQK